MTTPVSAWKNRKRRRRNSASITGRRGAAEAVGSPPKWNIGSEIWEQTLYLSSIFVSIFIDKSSFEDPTLADAIMDRVVHNAYRIEDIVT
jgi:hypothetical protein